MFRVRSPANRNDALQKKNLADTIQDYVLCEREEHSHDDKVLVFLSQPNDGKVIICFHLPQSETQQNSLV